jgi:hypothetical protein
MEPALASTVRINEINPGKPARRAQDQIAVDAFRGGERQYRLRIRIVADCRCKCDRSACASKIDRCVEGVATAGDAEAAVAAAGELDHHLADRDNASALFVHAIRASWLIRDYRLSAPAPPGALIENVGVRQN